MSGEEFAAIEARVAAATEGPWVRVENVHAESWVAVQGFEETRPITHDAFRPHFSTSPSDYGRANAEFVAHAREDIPALLAAVRERDNTIARVRALHVRNQDSSWTCGDWECEKCTEGDGHHGPVCDYCSFSTDDDTVPSVVFWPCTTVQIIDGLPAPGLRAALDPQETP